MIMHCGPGGLFYQVGKLNKGGGGGGGDYLTKIRQRNFLLPKSVIGRVHFYPTVTCYRALVTLWKY